MRVSFEYMTNLQYEVKHLRKLVEDFRSGEKYAQMKKQYRKIIDGLKREIRNLKAELAAAHAETVSVRNKWFQTCEDIIKEKEAELARKDREMKKATEARYEAERQRDEAVKKLHEKNVELYEIKTRLEDEKGKNLELTARINRDYTNSSKSSSQSPNHGKIHNGREKSGRGPGGQPGHPHHARKRREPTRTVEIPAPEEVASNEEYRPTGRLIRRQVVILHVSTEVVEYVTPEFVSKVTGKKVHAAFPEGVKDDVNYDATVKAAAYLLNQQCCVSISKTGEFLKEISEGRLELSSGMICGLSKEFSEKTQEERSEIFLELLSSPYMHVDFTFGRVNGKQGSVIICASEGRVLYQGREKKGHEGVKGSPAELYNGTIVSDHESTFQNYGSRHQECLVHVERYLRSSMENEPGLEWSGQMLEWIKEAIHYRNGVAGGGEPDEEKAGELVERYGKILEKAREEYEYEPPSEYFRDGYNTYRRMDEDRESYLLFLYDPTIPPTNNAAENAARKYKRKNAQAMCFRSEEGRDHFCDGLSVMESMKAKGENLYEGVKERFREGAGAVS